MINLQTALAPPPGDRRPWVVARLLGIDETLNRAQVSIDGGDPVWLRYTPGAYDGITTVYVMRDPYRTGSGQLVVGPAYAEDPAEVPPPPPPPPAPATPSPKTFTAVIRPTWSGTYRNMRNAWDRWNTERSSYGGRSTLYQGSSFGSGTLVGLATYGSQVTALGALEITSIVVTTALATGSGSVALQGAPHSSRPKGGPSPSGATANGNSSVTLTADMQEAFRTGTVKALASVGGSYRATFGTARADGMALRVTYRKNLG